MNLDLKALLFNNALVKKALADTNFYFLAQVGSKLLGLLTIPFLVRILSITEFAHYDIFLMLSSLITTVVVLGVDSGIAIMIADHKDDSKLVNFLFSYSLLFSTAVALISWALAAIIFPFIPKITPILEYIHYLFLYVIFNLVSYQVFNFIRWIGKAGVASVIGFVSYAIGVIFGFLLIYLKPNPVLADYLLGIVFGNFLGAIASLVFSYKHFSFRWVSAYKVYLKELMKVSLPYVPNYLANNVMMMTDRLVVVSLLGETSLGIYALANRFAQIPNFGFNIITRGFQPVMYLNYKEESGKSLIKKVYDSCHYAFIPALIVMFFLAPPIVLIFGGEKYLEAVPLIPVITMSALIYGIMGLNGMGYSIARKTYFLTLISMLSIVLNVVFNYFLGAHFGILGIAIGSLMVACIVSLMYTYLSEKLFSFNLNIKQASAIYFAIIVLSAIIFYTQNTTH
jgi:O-antigen/teichoic acid export membrane protein